MIWVMDMILINQRLRVIYKVFCKEHCKHRQKRSCTLTTRRIKLEDCPIGEWWDLNDWINKAEELVNLIRQKYQN